MTEEATTAVAPEAATDAPGHPLASLIPELLIADRCDRCGAQAHYAILLTSDNTEPLRFCSHHAARYEAALQSRDPFAVRDQRVEGFADFPVLDASA